MTQAINGRVGIETRTDRDYKEVVQGAETTLLFIVDGQFIKSNFDLITVKFGDNKHHVVTVVDTLDDDTLIETLLQRDDIQVFTCKLSAENTAALSPGSIRIEISFDDQKCILPMSLIVLKQVEE